MKRACPLASLLPVCVALLVALSGCANKALYEYCSSDEECASGVCEWIWTLGLHSARRCTERCTAAQVGTAAGCDADSTCSINEEGLPLCMPTCPGWRTSPASICVDGAFISCGYAEDRYCETCGCDSPDICRLMYHEPDEPDPPYCGPMGQTHDACSRGEECVSGLCMYCSDTEAPCAFEDWTCSVAIGEPCSELDCETCNEIFPGVTYCTKPCTWSGGCPEGSLCGMRHIDSDNFCWRRCDPDANDCPTGTTCGGVADEWGAIVDYACL